MPGATMSAVGAKPSVAAAYNPATIPGLQAWVKGDGTAFQDTARTTAASSDGDVVGSLTDYSGLNRHAEQATAARKPVLKTGANGLNGLPVLLFDGVDDWMAGVHGDDTAPMTFVILAKHERTTNNNALAQTSTSSSATNWGLMLFNETDTQKARLFNGSNTDANFAGAEDTTWQIYVARGDATDVRFYKGGGAAKATTGTGTANNQVIAVYQLGQIGTFYPGNFKLAEALFFTGSLTLTQINDLAAYLVGRWGVSWSTAT